MNIRKLFDEIRSVDLFNAFWSYPEEKNLSVLANKLSYIKSGRELRAAVAQICNQVFEEKEEGSFLYVEAQNLLKHAEKVIDKAVNQAGISGGYSDILVGKEDRDKNKFVMWENAVISKLCCLYKESLLNFTAELPVYEVREHVKLVLLGEEQNEYSYALSADQ